jgi:Fic family protein
VDYLFNVHKFAIILCMYDKLQPYNELPGLPPDFDFDDVEILKLVNKANIALSSFNGVAKLLPNRTIILQPLSVKEAVASSGIENINTTVSEVFRAELFPEMEATDAQKETLHYRDALLEGWGKVLGREFLNTNDYISLQEMIEPEQSGIRERHQTKEPVRIINTTTKEVVYTPPEGQELIRTFLKNYEDYYNNRSEDDGLDPLIKLALLHYQFEAIHPFRDGNGRTGRILMVLYLVLAKRLDLPMLFISGYILQNREEYYRRLRGVTENNEWKEWVVYILNAVIQQSKSSEVTIMGIKDLIDEYKELAKTKSLPNSSDFIDYLFSKPVYTYADLADKISVHRNTATVYLNQLVTAGVLNRTKYKREILFYNPKFTSLL